MLLNIMLFASTEDENRFLESVYLDSHHTVSNRHVNRKQALIIQKTTAVKTASEAGFSNVDDVFEAMASAATQAKKEAELIRLYRNGDIGSHEMGGLYTKLEQEGKLPQRGLVLTTFGEVVNVGDVLVGTYFHNTAFEGGDKYPTPALLTGLYALTTGNAPYAAAAEHIIPDSTSQIPSYVKKGDRLVEGQWIRGGQSMPTKSDTSENQAILDQDDVAAEAAQKSTGEKQKAAPVSSALSQRQQEQDPEDDEIKLRINPCHNGVGVQLQQGAVGVGLQWENMGNFIENFVNTTFFGHKQKRTIDYNGRKYEIKREADGPWYRDDVTITVKDLSTHKKAKIYVRHRYFDRSSKIEKKDRKAIEQALSELINR